MKNGIFGTIWRIFHLFFSNGSTTGNGAADRTPFDEEEWDDGHVDPLVDNGEPGIKVRALYDYEAAEDDELDFKAGNWYLQWSNSSQDWDWKSIETLKKKWFFLFERMSILFLIEVENLIENLCKNPVNISKEKKYRSSVKY